MSAQAQRDTKPELALRRAMFALGLRYRLQRRPEPALRYRLDIVFSGPRIAVDVRGCFWHKCQLHGTAPRANAERWADKLTRNVERDARIVSELQARGWIVIVVWEHDDVEMKAAEIHSEVLARTLTGADQPMRSRRVSSPALSPVAGRISA